MSSQVTTHLALPYLIAAQAQKHVTHNEALRALDAIVQLGVLDRTRTAPPAVSAEGDRHIVGDGATGPWTGKSGQIAAWQDGAWAFYQPRPGWLAWVASEAALLGWNGTAWGGVAAVNPTPLVGVNATADATNRLAVSSPASLFNHSGAGHQQKINKATAAASASTLFQTAFSGRAETGLAGDDDWRLKVSADGLIWTDAIRADRTTGRVELPSGLAPSTAFAPEIILATGQSNFRRTAAFAWTPPPNLRVWNWSHTTPTVVGTAFVAADATTINPAVQYAARVAEENPERFVYLINIAVDGLSIDQWLSTASTGTLMWPAVTDNVAAALGSISRTEITHMLFWQGEADVADGDNRIWETTLGIVFGQFQGQSWFRRSTPVDLFSINGTANASYANLVRAQGRFCRARPGNFSFVALDHFAALTHWDADTVHLTAAGMRAAGDAAFFQRRRVPALPAVRERLWAHRTYFVRTDGNDANTGLSDSATGAFLTIQKAINTAIDDIDFGAFNATIQVRAGTYAENLLVLAARVGRGNLLLVGDTTTPGNVIIAGSSDGLTVVNGGIVDIRGFRLQPGTGRHGLYQNGPGRVTFRDIEFAATTGSHIFVNDRAGAINAVGPYKIAGGAARHALALRGGTIALANQTVTLDGTPAFTSQFAYADDGSNILATAMTFSGSATGKRYDVQSNGVIRTGGVTTYFPGSIAGTTATGGQYV